MAPTTHRTPSSKDRTGMLQTQGQQPSSSSSAGDSGGSGACLLGHAAAAAAAAATDCASLLGHTFSNGTASVVLATDMPAGTNFSTDGFSTTGDPDLPGFCRVSLRIQISPETSATAEVWLPEPDTWNTRLLTVGNGGFAGSVNYVDIAWGLRKGFATTSTDTGHTSSGGDASWMLHHPGRTIDWAHRALHLTVVAANQVVAAYYHPAQTQTGHQQQPYSYYAGCSTGGRQGLAALQRYPADFDGVLAGSAIPWQTHTSAWQMYAALLQYPSSRSSFIPADLWASLISPAVMEQCDAALDGMADGVIMDPSRCEFRPEVLRCGKNGKGEANNTTTADTTGTACLTQDQVLNLERLYRPWLTSSGQLLNPGISPGGESSFATLMNSAEPLFGPEFYRNAVYNDTAWDWRTLAAPDIALADAINPGGANAYDPDLRPFESRGGKVLHYPLSRFYENTFGRAAGDVDAFYRLFMVPGMGHCSGGSGAWTLDGAGQGGHPLTVNGSSHSLLYSLVDWVEGAAITNNSSATNGVSAPEFIIGTKFVNDTPALGVSFTRPICRWPQTAVYDGVGDVNDAASWECPTAGTY
ncbi:tannase and feruloyl esterase [Apiospora saccharicola]|uniref:Carboxylic ester hydrolase n=1 Tax=Apiospora saccharicola TaxID=335842 RepID=A0ABR1WDK8_9PEZI